jgi:hypothetical protein
MSESDPIDVPNRKIAILIALLAAFLAISEMGGKSAQTEVLTQQVESSNMWSFFQAKTIRQTTLRTAAEAIEAPYKDGGGAMPPGIKAQVDAWRKTVQRYETEPETNEGRKELREQALAHDEKREKSRSAYHLFEYGSASFQLAIVLASAAAVTSVMWLCFIAGGLGLLGVFFTLTAFIAPTLIHL